MTDEERRIITGFVERVSGAANAAPARPASPWGALGGGAQPAQPPLPPVDPEADRLISDLMTRHPEARYRLTQMAFVQEAALVEMTNRIQQLEWEVENGRRQGAAAQNRGVLGGLFGGGGARPAAMPPRPQPQYPPGHNPGMMQRQGPGFLGTAMMTAAGVAGGLLLGNAIMGALGGGGAAEAATGGAFGQDAVPTSSGFEDPADAQAHDQGGYGDDAAAHDDGGYGDEEY